MLRRSASLSLAILTTLGLLATAPAALPQEGRQADEEHMSRMAAEHAADSAEPSPAAEAEPAGGVTSEEVVYATVDGREVKGFLAKPAAGGESAPGVIVIHEWWGLNDNIRSMAEQLAGAGYQALAVDLYGGEAATDSEGARALMSAAMENPDPLKENLRQAHAFLEEHGAPRVGSIGWCFGGAWSLQTALLLPEELDAAVIYYGRLVTDKEQLAALEMPILGLFGSEDRGIPVETVRAFEAALEELGKDASIHVYQGANHAFANPSGTRYDATAAQDAWAKTLDFFGAHLKG